MSLVASLLCHGAVCCSLAVSFALKFPGIYRTYKYRSSGESAHLLCQAPDGFQQQGIIQHVRVLGLVDSFHPASGFRQLPGGAPVVACRNSRQLACKAMLQPLSRGCQARFLCVLALRMMSAKLMGADMQTPSHTLLN